MLTACTLVHSCTLVMEMLIVHVALTSSFSSSFSYILLDCFTEIKLSVFKKSNYTQINQIAMDDSTERFQIYFYIASTVLLTN